VLCGGASGGGSSPVALPGSVVVGAAYGSGGGTGSLACEAVSAASGASSAYAALQLAVTPTLWPVWEDAIVATAATGELWSARYGYAASGGPAALLAAVGCGTGGGACNSTLAAAASSPAAVLTAARAVWGGVALPPGVAGTP
jgi:hypothetical protein